MDVSFEVDYSSMMTREIYLIVYDSESDESVCNPTGMIIEVISGGRHMTEE